MSSDLKFPALCIPRAMTFHTADFVEKALNTAMQGKFVQKIDVKTTQDKSGAEFNVFFIQANQDFPDNASTDIVYKNLRETGFVNISTGKGKFFWKVKLYIPNLKAKHVPKKVSGPQILDDAMTQEFKEWQRARQEAKKAKQTSSGPWEKAEEVEVVEEGELDD